MERKNDVKFWPPLAVYRMAREFGLRPLWFWKVGRRVWGTRS